jgi:succinate dehydrogenase / fumarate reductase flavoprotein subunit
MFNNGHAQAVLFAQGVEMSNLEMVQYHPTTVYANGKRMLISEAVRAEGGRLYSIIGGKKRYFMEEKYPTLGNLMPRDITSREIYYQLAQGRVFLDTSSVPKSAWDTRLSQMRQDVKFYLGIDPTKHPLEVAPSIHYFMGGIRVDRLHRTNVSGLLAVGECACQYHGANRLGGNSLLGAIYGGMVAGQSALETATTSSVLMPYTPTDTPFGGAETIQNAMGIVRNEETLKSALTSLETSNNAESLLCRAMLKSALLRTESRGSHFREDYPQTNPKLQRVSVAVWDGKNIKVNFQTVNGGESA